MSMPVAQFTSVKASALISLPLFASSTYMKPFFDGCISTCCFLPPMVRSAVIIGLTAS